MRPLRRTAASASGFLRRRLLSELAGNGAPLPRVGAVYAFGDNSHGAAGGAGPSPPSPPGTTTPSRFPPKGRSGRGAATMKVSSAAGTTPRAAIGCDGSLWVWGRSKRGQLGLGKDIVEAAVPSRVEALANYDIVKVSFGWGHAMALTKDGGLLGWGYSENGRLGEIGHITQASSAKELLGKTVDKYSSSMLEAVEKMVEEKIRSEDNMPIIWEPSLVHEVCHVEVSDVSCGLDHSLVLCSDGIVLSGGDNTYGQLGRKSAWSKFLPVDISHSPFSVSASVGHSLATCIISTEGDDHAETGVLSWGWNCSSQLGRPGKEDVPALVDGLNGERPVSASAGRVHSVALTSKGEVWAWGSGRNGRLGLGSSMDEPEPFLIDTLEGAEVSQVAAGMDHTLLLVAE
uniref:RCC1-like domain-containing protein n=1 Tax=Oryza rufipogon TaxID=4529 RepID=A0A0E0NB77_ORYRU